MNQRIMRLRSRILNDLAVLAAAGLMLSCDRSSKIEILEYQPVAALERLEDSTYFSLAQCINSYHNGSIVVSDLNNSRFLQISSDFKLMESIDRKGSGPGEVIEAEVFAIYKDSLFAYGAANPYDITVYSLPDGKYVRSIRTPTRPSGRFVVTGQGIFLATPRLDYPITQIDFGGRIVNEFGKWYGEGAERFYRNDRILLTDFSGSLVSVSQSEPTIQKYTMSGALLKEFDLSTISELNPLWKSVKQRQENEKRKGNLNVTIVLVNDALIEEDKLYVWCTHWQTSGPGAHVIVIDLSQKAMVPTKLLKLYSSDKTISIWGGKFGFGRKGNLFLFNKFDGQLYKYDLSVHNLQNP